MMVWLKVPSAPIEPILAAYVLPPCPFVSMSICRPTGVRPELPPTVQLLKVPVSKLPLPTRFEPDGGGEEPVDDEELVTVTSTALDAALVPADVLSVAVKA